jgi:hypothetical protein
METQTQTTSLMDDLTRLLKRVAPGGPGMAAFIEGRRLDIEALLALSRVAGTGATSAVDKQLETLRVVGEDLRNALAGSTEGEGGRTEAVRDGARKAVAGFADLAEVVLDTQSQAFESVSRRAKANVEELKALLGSGS